MQGLNRDQLHEIDWSDVATGKPIGPVLPGEVLRLEFLEPLGLSARQLARDIAVPPNRITEILNGARAITASTAVGLAMRFGTSDRFWLNLQIAHDLEIARKRRKASILEQLRKLEASQSNEAEIDKLRRQIKQLSAVA